MKKIDLLKLEIEPSVVDFLYDIYNTGRLFELWQENHTLTVENYKEWLHEHPIEGTELEAFISLTDEDIWDVVRNNIEGLIQYKCNMFYSFMMKLPYKILKNLIIYEKWDSLIEYQDEEEFAMGVPVVIMEFIYLNELIGTDYHYQMTWEALEWYVNPNK